MFGKPRSSIPVAGKTGIPVKRTAQSTASGRSTPTNSTSSIPVASKVSGKRLEGANFDLREHFHEFVDCKIREIITIDYRYTKRG